MGARYSPHALFAVFCCFALLLNMNCCSATLCDAKKSEVPIPLEHSALRQPLSAVVKFPLVAVFAL